jgi:saccharopine dehydrogenase-like NADP-dependent oxidoreductase
MKKITLFGAGLIGKTIAKDLATHYQLNVIDYNTANLDTLKDIPNINRIEADISDGAKIKNLVQDADLVIGAVPGFMGFNMVKNVIKAKKNIVDISFFPEDPYALDALAKENNVTVMVDCGVAPGLDNIICGYYHAQYKVHTFACYVGGLPVERKHPFAYKAPFSPIDVIEEYTRPARLVEHGTIVTKPALSEREMIDYPKVGTLQAFNTDGLRTLLKLPIPNMKEKTLRYPGHITYISALQSIGFFSEDEIDVNGVKVRPIDVTSKILLPQWKLQPTDCEFTIMENIVTYEDGGEMKKASHFLFDEYDASTQTSSMARTTGYTCNAIANLVANEKFNQKGVYAGEHIGMNKDCYEAVHSYLEARGVKQTVTITNI